jgi:hypothetical protein
MELNCVATGYRWDDRLVRVVVLVVQLWAYLASYPTEVKQQRREAHHSPPSSAELNKAWIYISTPPYVFIT